MGFKDALRTLGKALYPEYPAQVVSIEPRRLGPPRIHLLVYTGYESIWQPPLRDWVDTPIPKGIELTPGTLLVIQETSSKTRRILWDRPPPALPARRLAPTVLAFRRT